MRPIFPILNRSDPPRKLGLIHPFVELSTFPSLLFFNSATGKRPHADTIWTSDVDLHDRALRKELKYTLKHWGKDPSRAYSPVSSVITYDLDADIESDEEMPDVEAGENEDEPEDGELPTAVDASSHEPKATLADVVNALAPVPDGQTASGAKPRKTYTAMDLRMVQVQVWVLEKQNKELESTVKLMKSENQSLRDQLNNLKAKQQQQQQQQQQGGSSSRAAKRQRKRSRTAGTKAVGAVGTGANATMTAAMTSAAPART